MQLSLSTLLLSVIRYQIVTYGGVPFGSFLAPAQTASISYMLSSDLWGPITSRNLRSRRSLWLTISTVAVIILASLIGPSGAVLIIPRPGRSLVHKSLMIYGQVDRIFPNVVGGEMVSVL